jgi:hypothetical protein
MADTTTHAETGVSLDELLERPAEDWDAVAAAVPAAPRPSRRSLVIAACLVVTAVVGVVLIAWLAPFANAAGGCGGG